MFVCTGCSVMLDEDQYRRRKNGYRNKRCRACERAVARQQYEANPSAIRERKRTSMARWRDANPEVARERSRQSHHRRKDRVNARAREATAARIFWARAKKLPGITPRQLFGLWRRQKGLCALTGRRLGRDAQVDHILPKARGGADDIGNLQWVCAEANLAKRNLTDAEFLALCQDVSRWIGERIQMVERITETVSAAA